MRIGWQDSLRELPYWTSLSPIPLTEATEPTEIPHPFRLIARSTTTRAAAVLLQDQDRDLWVRILFWKDAEGWNAMGQRVTPPPPAHFWRENTGEVARVYTRGTVERRHSLANVVISDLVILHRPEVTALLVDGERFDCRGNVGIVVIVSESTSTRQLKAEVAGQVVPVWYSAMQ
jgi:hypothetical protein